MLGKETAVAIGTGLIKNQTLTTLNLSGNRLPNDCMQDWSGSECLGLFSLNHLDLSDNIEFGDDSILQLLHGLRNRIGVCN